jgi:hypothetical protein
MDEKLFLHVKYSARDYARVSGFMKQQKFLNKYSFIFMFVGVFVTIAAFTFMLADDKSSINYLGLITVSLLPALALGGLIYFLEQFLSPALMKRSVAKQIKSSPALNEEQAICFSTEGIEISGELFSQKIKWEAIIKAIESETDFIFYTTRDSGKFFPKTAFVSETDANFIRCLARAKLGDKAEI